MRMRIEINLQIYNEMNKIPRDSLSSMNYAIGAFQLKQIRDITDSQFAATAFIR